MISSEITHQESYKGYSLYFSVDSEGHYVDILERNLQLLTFMTQKHSQTLVVRLDVRFSDGMLIPEDNSCFQYFIENYRRYMVRHKFDPYYLWVRERAHADHFHYHCYFLLNGNNIRYLLLNSKDSEEDKKPSKADELWSAACGLPESIKGLVHITKFEVNGYTQRGIMVHRNDRAAFADAYWFISYLAKVATKGSSTRYVREFGSSKLPYDNFYL